MTTYGLTADGFVKKSLTTLLDETSSGIKNAFGSSVRTDAKSAFGQLNGIISDRLSELWEVAEAITASDDPDASTGAGLDSLVAITGLTREEATKSTVTEMFTGTVGTVLPVGREVSEATTGVKFTTLAEATIVAATAWVINTAYVVGDRVTNSTKVYVCITAGTSAGAGGPTTTSTDITDNTAHWKYVGAGAGFVDIVCESNDTGPILAVSGTLTVIDTAVAGLSSVHNLLDATPGTDIETDTALRIRRDADLAAGETATPEAIRTAMLSGVTGVTSCHVFQNRTDTTDADGVTPHSIEVLVQGGDDQDIADALWLVVGASIGMVGVTSKTVVDSEGNDQIVKFTRPTAKTIYITITLVKDPDVYPSDGDAEVKLAVVERGDLYAIGYNVTASAQTGPCFTVPGVLDVTNVKISFTVTPTVSTTLVLTTRELATFDTSRIILVTSDGTP